MSIAWTDQIDLVITKYYHKGDQATTIPECDPFEGELCILRNTYEDNVLGTLLAK